MICHSFIQEGGGSSLDQLVIVFFVIISSGGRGKNLRCTMSFILPFFFLKAPLIRFAVITSMLPPGISQVDYSLHSGHSQPGSHHLVSLTERQRLSCWNLKIHKCAWVIWVNSNSTSMSYQFKRQDWIYCRLSEYISNFSKEIF